MTHSVVSTNVARCRDCYRCVRNCPVKAVRIQGGQAQVVAELCIVCGTCVRECPQGAKIVRNDRSLVREALAAGRTVVASVAPSAPAYFGIRSFAQMEVALRALGFAAAHETAFGAEMVGHAHREWVETEPGRRPVITSSCPVVVSLVEIYYPDLIPHLAPVVSPMIAHGRWLRGRYGNDAFLVFIGPCFAKKGEIHDDAVRGIMDAALTYEEIAEWMQAESVTLPAPPEGHESVPRANARAFPVEGGLVGTANLNTDILASEIVTTSGLAACKDVLQSIRNGSLQASLVELMACEGGCINGPGMGRDVSVYLARQRVLDYAARRQPQPLPSRAEWPSLSRTYRDKSIPLPEFTEEQIREVLHRVDKYTPEDELNCGACGYPTCRDKAIATLRGLAEATMCIPYTRKRAESLRQVIMAVTEDPVITVDTRLHVQDLSPSAEAMLGCSIQQIIGHPLAELAPSAVLEGFERVRQTGQPILRQRLTLNGLIVEQTVVAVRDHNLIVGILRDVTEREQQRAQLERIRDETLRRTQEVVTKQMRVAHEIAQLLGETTADTKIMLSRLAKLLEEGREP